MPGKNKDIRTKKWNLFKDAIAKRCNAAINMAYSGEFDSYINVNPAHQQNEHFVTYGATK